MMGRSPLLPSKTRVRSLSENVCVFGCLLGLHPAKGLGIHSGCLAVWLGSTLCVQTANAFENQLHRAWHAASLMMIMIVYNILPCRACVKLTHLLSGRTKLGSETAARPRQHLVVPLFYPPPPPPLSPF